MASSLTRFKKLKSLFGQCREILPEYFDRIQKSLSIAEEINKLIQEESVISEYDRKSLAEISRDILIFRSRVAKYSKEARANYSLYE